MNETAREDTLVLLADMDLARATMQDGIMQNAVRGLSNIAKQNNDTVLLNFVEVVHNSIMKEPHYMQSLPCQTRLDNIIESIRSHISTLSV